MIVVKIELHSAITKKVTLLGTAIISNMDMSADGTRADYNVKVGRKDKLDFQSIHQNPLREGKVVDYPRLTYNVWRLVIRALKSAFPEEK